MSKQPLGVAVPWSLSHYVPLNGFHPLYRALFDQCSKDIEMAAWDNVELSHVLRGDVSVRNAVLASVPSHEVKLKQLLSSSLVERYVEGYFPSNIALTSLLPGEIEFHHTAPFPTLARPFVFHCESFAPIFFPFSQQGAGKLSSQDQVREHYGRILGSPLCLGIFSHIPNTLDDIATFFSSDNVEKKLFASRIGLSDNALCKHVAEKRSPLTSANCLFVNSANQNPANFFHRGGHVVLRFWRELRALGHTGKLYLRCARPSDHNLMEYGVDAAFVKAEEGHTIVWIQDYLSNSELNALMANAHFFLLPSASLHSVSILQAMATGTVPVVSDTVGTDVYVRDNIEGVILKGVLAANWTRDQKSGVLVDQYRRNQMLDESLVEQLTQRISAVLKSPETYSKLRASALESSRTRFSGTAFSNDFWTKVIELYAKQPGKERSFKYALSRNATSTLHQCIVERKEWPRIFESVPQPVMRIFSGNGRVTELGGAFIHVAGSPGMELHDWSVLSEYLVPGAPRLNFAKTVKELGGRYMTLSQDESNNYLPSLFVDHISSLLLPYPTLHRFAARVLKIGRRVRRRFSKAETTEHARPDIQLLVSNVSGMNVIRFSDKYYAIPQGEGEFQISKVNANEYSTCISGNSVKQVLQKIAESDISGRPPFFEAEGKNLSIALVEEGVDGFNIVRFSERYYAIPQGEGAFEYDRVLANSYSQVYSLESVEEIKSAIAARRR